MISANRKLIGLVGRKGSGKGTVAKILKERYGAHVYRFSDILREEVKKAGQAESRENLIAMSEKMRHELGENILIKKLIEKISNDDAPLTVLDGIRRLGDLDGLDEFENFTIIDVYAPPQIRHERLRKRGENAGETTRSYESFLELENAPTEITIEEVEKKADVVIDNSEGLEVLEKNIENTISVILRQEGSSNS